MEKALPDAMPPDPELKEHDTLNVNISASGIAFSCGDRFNEGDYLLIRLVLLAGMEVIITYCRVVYCKNSNPYENTYPYLVGAHFINVQEKDWEVLVKHVDKKKKQQFIVNGLIGVLVMTVLAFPGEALHLVLAMLHRLFETFLHLSHLGFESVEFGIQDELGWGKKDPDILTLGVVYKGAAIPVYGLVPDKQGTAASAGASPCCSGLSASSGGRESIGDLWWQWLSDHGIPYLMRKLLTGSFRVSTKPKPGSGCGCCFYACLA